MVCHIYQVKGLMKRLLSNDMRAWIHPSDFHSNENIARELKTLSQPFVLSLNSKLELPQTPTVSTHVFKNDSSLFLFPTAIFIKKKVLSTSVFSSMTPRCSFKLDQLLFPSFLLFFIPNMLNLPKTTQANIFKYTFSSCLYYANAKSFVISEQNPSFAAILKLFTPP